MIWSRIFKLKFRWPVLTALAGATVLLSFAPFEWYAVAWVALVPLLASEPAKPWQQRLLAGFSFGVVFYGLGLGWLPDSIASFMGFSPLFAWLGFALIVVFLAIFPATFCLLLGYVASFHWRVLVLAPALMVALDTIRFNALGGLPWLSLGASQIDGPLNAWYSMVGEAGVTWIVVLINGLFAVALANRRLGSSLSGEYAYRLTAFGAAVLMLATAIVMSAAQELPDVATTRIGIVQASVPGLPGLTDDERTQYIDEYRQLAAEILDETDLIVLPEAAIDVSGDEWQKLFSGLLTSGTDLLTGVLETTSGSANYNSARLFTGQDSALYRKQRPVPVAEARPEWLDRWLFSERPHAKPILNGRITAPLDWRENALGLSICWEIQFGTLVANRVRDGATVLVNLANESWVRSDIAQARTLAVARVRAAENGRMLVRVANRGISALIDTDGSVVESFEPDTTLATVFGVTTHEQLTPFTAYRMDWLIGFVAFTVVTVVFGATVWLSSKATRMSVRTRRQPANRRPAMPARAAEGFSLVELVVVITILGVLAATVFPRLVGLNDEAEEAVFETVRGGFASGVNLARARARAITATSGPPSSISMGGVQMDVTTEGWPSVAQASGNCAIAMIRPDGESMLARIEPGTLVLEFVLGIATAQAAGGDGGGGGKDGGGGGGGPCSVLDLVIIGDKVNEWTTSVASSVATFTDPGGRSFSYDESTGAVF